MADETNVLTQEQRDYYENETGQKLPDEATWDSLSGEQKAVLSDVYAPKSAEAQEFAGQFKEPEQEAAYVENREPMKLEDALKAADGKELYNLSPNELAEMNNVLRTAAIDGNEDAVLGYGKVRLAMEEKMKAYADGKIETPIEWAGGMQAMLRAAQERLPEREPYKEEPVQPMTREEAEKAMAELRGGKDFDIKTLASLSASNAFGNMGPDYEALEKAIASKLSKTGKDIPADEFSSVDFLLEKASHMPESMFSAKEHGKIKARLETSRRVVNTVFDEPRIAELAQSCEGKLKEFTETYDKEHGLWMMTSEDAERVSENIAAMSNMGKDALDKAEYKEEPVQPMTREEAEKAMAELRKGKDFDMKTLASLSASNVFGNMGPDYEALEKAIASKLSKVGKKVPADELSSMDFLLEKASHLPESMFPAKKYEKVKAVLDKNREEAKKNPAPKYPEMADAMVLFDNLEITDGLSLTGKAKSKENDELKAQLLESIRLKTMEGMAGTKPGPIDPAEFNKEFAANIVAEVGRLAGVENVVSGDSKTIEDYAKNHKIQISKGALIGYQAAQSAALDGFAARLESKVGKKNAGVESLRQQGKSLDERVAKNAPKKQYALLKSLAKTAGWSGAYYVAGATMGPAGIAVVATASLANQALKLRKEYKKQKEEMAKKGKKLKLWSFLKNNKMALASAALTALGAATAGISSAELAPELVKTLTQAKATSGIALGAASTVKAFRDVRRAGGSVWKAMGAAGMAGAGTAWAVIAGQTSHESAAVDTTSDVSTPETPVQESPSQETIQMVDRDNDGIPDSIDRDGGEGWANEPETPVQESPSQETIQMVDRDNDGIPDSIDRDGGEGWANEPETPVQEETAQEQAAVQETSQQVEDMQSQEERQVEESAVLDKEGQMPPLEAAGIEIPEPAQPDMTSIDAKLQAHLESIKTYAVEDPHSGEIVKFSLGENGEILTQNAGEIGLVGSEELHAAITERIGQEVGHLSDRELAFFEKNMSAEQYNDVMLADAQIKIEQDSQQFINEAEKVFSNQGDVHTADQLVAENQSETPVNPSEGKASEESQSQISDSQEQQVPEQPKELSVAEKIEALKHGKSVEEATAARNTQQHAPMTAQNINQSQTPIKGIDPRGGGYTA